MQNATLHQLKVFSAVARHNSFTRAAEELFLTQPTVSMQVKQLSKTVGLSLFEQVGKRLYLTEAGKELYTTCQEIFEQLSRFEIAIADIKGLKQGKLRIAVVTTAKYVIPRILGPFCHRYPGIDISLTVTNHQFIIEGMLTNQNDLYIMSQVPEEVDVQSHPFLENPLVVLACRNHPLVGEQNIPIARLADEPFIMREPGSNTRKEVQRIFEENHLSLRVKLDLGSNEAIKQAVAGGLGISVLSKHTLALDGLSSQVAILNVVGFPIQRHWYVVYPTGKQMSAIALAFFDYLLNEGKQVAEATAFQGLMSSDT
jgi:LysR family transcriptional regulator, low CO2-responsive transcriptional regulator